MSKGVFAVLALCAALSVVAADVVLPSPHIVGGREVSILRHPHQISLRRRSDVTQPYGHSCGGSIYNENIVLTAAHCVVNRDPANYTVVAGTENRRGSDGAIVRVDKIVWHEAYNGSLYINDIAVLFLSSPLPLNGLTMAPAKLATAGPFGGETSTVTGWGTTSEGGVASDRLLEVDVPIVSNAVCDQYYGGDRITDDMVCAGLVDVGGIDACQGDSGGPLMVNGELVGIVSWGRGCARPDYPGVYARVSYFLDWIAKTIADNQ